MDSNQFKEFGYEAINYMANYIDGIRDRYDCVNDFRTIIYITSWFFKLTKNLMLRVRQVLPAVEPGYLNDKIPEEIPEKGEQWQQMLTDFDRIIMPGVSFNSHRSQAEHSVMYSSTRVRKIVGSKINSLSV